jgi:hypothetical protein
MEGMASKAALAALAVGLAASSPGGRLAEDFSGYPAGNCLAEGSRLGPWRVVYAEAGCARVGGRPGRRWLHENARESTEPDVTHAILVTGPALSLPLRFSARVKTVEQLRGGSPPNAWEVGWLVWDYRDRRHFYYFIPRADGWELGKRDPAYPEGQRYLASGKSPRFPFGTWASIRILQDGASLAVEANGARVARFTDRERPYLGGRIGLYTEDAHAHFADVTAGPAP